MSSSSSSTEIRPHIDLYEYVSPTRNIKNTLAGRVCASWRMAPGVIVLVALVIAAICSCIWNYYTLCIPYAVAVIADLYLIYLGWQFRHLQTFAQSNVELRRSLEELQEEYTRLQTQLNQFERENERLKTSLLELEALVAELKKLESAVKDLELEKAELEKTNVDLKKNVKNLNTNVRSLNSTVNGLEDLNKSLETKAAIHVKSLEGVQKRLSQLQESTTQDHHTFAENLKLFQDEVTHLQETRSNFDETGSAVAEQMRAQAQTQLESFQMLESIFSEIAKWKDNEHISKQVDVVQKLNVQVLELEKTLSQGKGQLMEQDKQIKELREIKEGFNELLTKLLEVADEIQDHAGAEKVRTLTNKIKTYETK